MPSKTKAQADLMRAVAHNPAFAKKVGIPQSVGEDFSKADKGRKFGAGGNVKKEMKAAKIFAKAGEKKLAAHERREAMGKEEDTPAIAKKEMSVLKKAKAPKDVMEYEKSEHAEMGMKRGGKVKRMAGGGNPNSGGGNPNSGVTSNDKYPAFPRRSGESGLEEVEVTGARMPTVTVEELQEDEMAKKGGSAGLGGMAGSGLAGAARRGTVTVEPYNERFKKGGSVGGGFRRVADGIASKGKTKGTMVRMASGGSVSSASRRADGIAQRGKTRGRMV